MLMWVHEKHVRIDFRDTDSGFEGLFFFIFVKMSRGFKIKNFKFSMQ